MLFHPKVEQCLLCKGTGLREPLKIEPDYSLTPDVPVEPVLPDRQYDIMIIGEAYGAEEARLGMPFVGSSGSVLNEMLEEAGINRLDCFVTNVFNLQPKPTNDVKNLTTAKALSSVPMPEMQRGAYLQDQYFPEVQRLWKEVEAVNPKIIICLGNSALWAMTGTYGLKPVRGTAMESTLGVKGYKLIATYHPAAILRDWSMRSIAVVDLMKAKRQSTFREVRRPSRKIWIDVDIRDIEAFYNLHWLKASVGKFDIETVGTTQITCVGFATSEELAIVIPFVDNRKPGGNYWPTAHQEKLAWKWVGKFLQHEENPALQLGGQNTLYDINWLWSKVGITPKNYVSDTMLLHHAYSPEHEKGLGFLGSIYTDEPAWKLMRKSTANKKGE